MTSSDLKQRKRNQSLEKTAGAIALSYHPPPPPPILLLMTYHEETWLNANRSPNPNSSAKAPKIRVNLRF